MDGPCDNLGAENESKYDEIKDHLIYDELNETSPYDKVPEETDSKYYHEINSLTYSDITTPQKTSNDKFNDDGKDIIIQNSNYNFN